MSITSDDPIKGTCCVCGKLVNALLGAIPPVPGSKSASCSKCGAATCPEHHKQHEKSCGKIESVIKDWCKTPPLLP